MQTLLSHKSIKKCIALGMALILSLGCVTAYADTKKDLNKQKNDAEQRLKNANESVGDIEDQRDEAEAEVEEADQQLVQLLATIDILDDEIAAKKVDVQVSGEAYDKAKAEEDRQYKEMKERIRFMYEKGDSQYLEILMQSASFADAVNKADYVEKIYDYDRQLLERYDETAKEAKALHERLLDEEAELEGMQLEFKEQQSELEKTITEKKAVVENFEEKLSAARSEAKKYENQIKEVNTEIARIAAKEKAEREAKEKAEKAAKASSAKKAAEQGQAETGGDESSQEGKYKDEAKNNTESQEGTYDESSQEGKYKEPEKEKESSGAKVSGSGTGAEIASYACQFIGNPYVAGGTSLTNGCDCSGFTMSVYSHFGYKIPRTSSEQLGYGKGVSYSEAKAGDIMCYAGHVGIYIGNGMIVHASTPATGIRTTVATYRPIIGVRRIVD
ncbi:MAG: C40 family peptidase [Lachnospiraceae bacterium]|nr:C40 family peptidase [Lachnospiraceae bacterium]